MLYRATLACLNPHLPRSSMTRTMGSLMLAVCLALTAGSSVGQEATATFTYTIENTSGGQNFSRPVLLFHGSGFKLFEIGEPSSDALWLLAEEGDTRPLSAFAESNPSVSQAVVAPKVHRRRSPVVTGQFESNPDRLLSLAAMLTLTNDGFVAVRGAALPAKAGEVVVHELRAYDAGSEVNTELCTHVPCKVHGIRATEGAEGKVQAHPGIRGDADIELRRGWEGNVLGTITIERTR